MRNPHKLSKKEIKEIENKPLGKKLNFNDFWEESKKNYKKEYNQEKKILQYRKFSYQEEAVPSVSPPPLKKKKPKNIADVIQSR